MDNFSEDIVSHPGGAVPKVILVHLLAPLDRSLDPKRHAGEVVLVLAFAQIHLCGSQDVSVCRTVDDSVIVWLHRNGVLS